MGARAAAQGGGRYKAPLGTSSKKSPDLVSNNHCDFMGLPLCCDLHPV